MREDIAAYFKKISLYSVEKNEKILEEVSGYIPSSGMVAGHDTILLSFHFI